MLWLVSILAVLWGLLVTLCLKHLSKHPLDGSCSPSGSGGWSRGSVVEEDVMEGAGETVGGRQKGSEPDSSGEALKASGFRLPAQQHGREACCRCCSGEATLPFSPSKVMFSCVCSWTCQHLIIRTWSETADESGPVSSVLLLFNHPPCGFTSVSLHTFFFYSVLFPFY